MKITITRSGGYAGSTENIAKFSTAEMDPSKAQHVEQTVKNFGFFNMPASVTGGGIGADFFHYEIKIRDGERQHTISFDDDDSPMTAPLRKFVEALVQGR
jgi:hypothetical protein